MYSDGQIFIFLVSPQIFVIKGLDFHADLLNLIEASIIHPLLKRVLPDQFLNVYARFLQINLEQIDLLPQIKNGIFVYLIFDS